MVRLLNAWCTRKDERREQLGARGDSWVTRAELSQYVWIYFFCMNDSWPLLALLVLRRLCLSETFKIITFFNLPSSAFRFEVCVSLLCVWPPLTPLQRENTVLSMATECSDGSAYCTFRVFWRPLVARGSGGCQQRGAWIIKSLVAQYFALSHNNYSLPKIALIHYWSKF